MKIPFSDKLTYQNKPVFQNWNKSYNSPWETRLSTSKDKLPPPPIPLILNEWISKTNEGSVLSEVIYLQNFKQGGYFYLELPCYYIYTSAPTWVHTEYADTLNFVFS